MSITIVKEPQNIYSGLPNYLVATSDNSGQNKFEFVTDILYDSCSTINFVLSNFVNDTYFINATINQSDNEIKEGDLIGANITNNVYGTFNVVSKNGNDLVLNLIDDKYSRSAKTLYAGELFAWIFGSVPPSRSVSINHVIRKKISPDTNGYGVIDFNSVLRNEVAPKYKDYQIGVDMSDYRCDYSYVIFEEYLLLYEISGTSTPSDSKFNRFDLSSTLDFDMLNVDDYVIVNSDDPTAEPFYNGIQKVTSLDSSTPIAWFETDKPQKFGTDSDTRKAYLASQDTTAFLETTLTTNRYITFGNPYFNDFSNVTNTLEYNNRFNDITILNKSIVPTINDINIDDLGYFIWQTQSTSNIRVEYRIYDSNGLDISYDINVISDDVKVYYIPTHPKTYNDYIDANGVTSQKINCDHVYYTVQLFDAVNQSKLFRYNLKKLDRVRIIHSDNYGHYQGFDFFGVCKKTNSSDSFNYEQNTFAWNGSNEIITYDNLTRGYTPINSLSTESWVLNTSYLNDEQSKYFKTLLISSDSYIQDYEGNLNACIINTNSIEEKRNKNGLVRYTLSVKLANTITFYGN